MQPLLSENMLLRQAAERGWPEWLAAASSQGWPSLRSMTGVADVPLRPVPDHAGTFEEPAGQDGDDEHEHQSSQADPRNAGTFILLGPETGFEG
jgi:hypothetical protein